MTKEAIFQKAFYLNDIKKINFTKHSSHPAFLISYELPKAMDFDVQRVFIVHADTHTLRGQHAHYQCQQLLICTQGQIDVDCFDGSNRQTYHLNNPTQALLIPPTIWAEETYYDNSCLMVICDRRYEENDYIRDPEQFISFRRNK